MKNKLLIIVLLTFLVSCTEEQTPYSNSFISSPHPLASQVGKVIYSKGGNAFDAAVASAFTLSVVEPSMSGIGGRLQVIYKQAGGEILGIDATTQIPESFDNNDMDLPSYGYKTIGIPGVVAGLVKLHEENGVLDLQTVMQPSISIAENGFMILPGEIKRQQYEKEKIESFEGTKMYFLNSNGESFKPGDLLIQKDLAKTLTAISKNGKKGFYEGEIAEKIANDIQSNGGFITTEDLKNYSAKESEVLTGKFNGYDVNTLNLPSYGSITIQMIQIMDQLKIESERDWNLKVSRAVEEAYRYRPYQKDVDSVKSILSVDRAKQIALDIENNHTDIVDISQIKKSEVADMAQGHTAHLTTSDKYGNVVSLTQTLGPNMGSKVASKGLGFLYNVTMGPYLGGYLGEDKPGDRASSHISPTIFSKGDKVVLALGAAGGNKIPVAINQVAYRYLKTGMPLVDAIFFPRVYKSESPIYIESHLGINHLSDYEFYPESFNVEMIRTKAYFGRVHAIALDSINGKWFGSADPDWEGTVSSFE
jgi:gamma-glutamyltranspeptidase/glutathione hydrolase